MPTNPILKFWHALLYGNMSARSGVHRDHMYVINVYMVLSLLSVTIFGLLHVLGGNKLIGYLELAGGVAIVINILGLHATRNINLARTYLLLTIMALLLVMLLTGGTQGTGIFWFFIFPITAFLLAGKRQGVWWMAALCTLTLATLLLAQLSLIHISYDFVTVRQLIVVLVVTAVGIYAYQAAREVAIVQSQVIDHAKSEFVATASHQLRTPVSAIAWFSEMLLNGDAGKLTQEQRLQIEQIYQSNRRMTALIGDLLIVSSLDLGKLYIKPVKSDIAEMSHTALQTMKDRFLLDKTLTIKEQYDKHLPAIAVDQEIMRTTLESLISNAIKYTPDKGKVTIRISRSADKLFHDSQGSLRIEIQDTGYGIPSADQEELFTKFFRAKNIHDKDTDGTGLGLFIVREMLDLSGGAISFSSIENSGSTFTVKVPLEGMREQTPNQGNAR